MIDRDFRPTMLIGAGGTGARIAERVYAELQSTRIGRDGKVIVVAVDTDDNDMRELRYVEPRNRLLFSTADPIRRIIERNRDAISHWFLDPARIPENLKAKSLIDGAQQIRIFTQLALYTTMLNPKLLNDISNAFTSLSQIDNTDRSGMTNVMIVGSLAGATGSGSFVQLGLIAKLAAAARSVPAQVRGLFLMPDIYANTALRANQIPNVRANAYAALKELNAANMLADGADGLRGFGFEYAPGKYVEAGNFPYEFMSFLDYETSSGRTLAREVSRYVDMAAKVVFQLLFTPIGGRVRSESTNDALQQYEAAAQASDNRYASTGLGRIVFPRDDIADYLTGRFALENLEGDWLQLDRQYEATMRAWRDQRREGASAGRPPERGAAYLDDLRELATKERAPFFREIHENLNPELEDARGVRAVRPLHGTYLNALETAVMDRFWSLDTMKDPMARRDANIDPSQVNDPADAPNLVMQLERALDDDLRTIEDQSRLQPVDILSKLLAQADQRTEREWQPEHLQAYTVRGGPHVVQIRAFLYALQAELRDRRDGIDLEASRKRLFGLANKFRTPEERQGEIVERGTPRIIDEASKASQTGLLSRLTGNKGLAGFAEEYATYHNTSRRVLREYTQQLVLRKIYAELDKQVDLYLSVVQGLMGEIETVLERLRAQTAQSENRHSATDTESAAYWICADREAKLDFWETLQRRTGDDRQSEGVNRSLADGLFGSYREARRDRREPDYARIREIFEASLIDGHCRRVVEEVHGGLIDLSVIEALRRDCARTGADWKVQLREIVRIVAQQSEPFVSLVDRSQNGNQAIYWAVNPVLAEHVADAAFYDELLSSNQGEKRLEREEFPEREMICVHSRVNLRLEHLAKLSPGGADYGNIAAGSYFVEYERRIKELLGAEMDQRTASTLTPHVHRDWHRPGAMPEFHKGLAERQFGTAYRGLVQALASGALHQTQDYGEPAWEFSTRGMVDSGSVQVKLTSGVDMHDAVKAFETRAELADAMAPAWDRFVRPAAGSAAEACEKSAAMTTLLDRQFLSRFMDIAAVRDGGEERDDRLRRSIAAWAMTVRDVVGRLRTDLAAIGQAQEAARLMAGPLDAALDALAGIAREETMRRIRDAVALGQEDYANASRL